MRRASGRGICDVHVGAFKHALDEHAALETPPGHPVHTYMEENKIMRETIRDMLISFGYEVMCAENGAEALDLIAVENKKPRQFVGMIFDLTVPGGMGGKEAAAMARETKVGVPVFAASKYADDPVMKNPSVYGFTASICKPFLRSELFELLNRHMGMRES